MYEVVKGATNDAADKGQRPGTLSAWTERGSKPVPPTWQTSIQPRRNPLIPGDVEVR